MARTVHVPMLIAIHTAALDKIDAEGATGYVNIYDSTPTLLSTLPLDFPCGTVSGTTGQLTITPGAPDAAAAASGTAATAVLCDAADTELITLTCAAGTTPVADTCVLASLSIVAGAPVELISFTIG